MFYFCAPEFHSIYFLVHPCDKKTYGGCEQVCNKDGENAKCSCEPAEEFTLNADGKTCDKSSKGFYLSLLQHKY